MTGVDPIAPDWLNIDIPDAWSDNLRLWHPRDLCRFVRHLCGHDLQAVQLPEGTPYAENIPKYILQAFHNLPNGNYSRRFTRGYITGFNKVMLGEISKSHAKIVAQLLQDPAMQTGSALDIGCGGGGLAGALHAAGIPDVWGLDPSPYLLKHAAHDWPQVRFIPGIAEKTDFPDARFHAITACFLLHEIPPRFLEQCLQECARLLKPNGWLAFCEPSPMQIQQRPLALWQQYGWRGLYFYMLARKLHEPFLMAWHKQDIPALLAKHGFDIISHDIGVPMRHVLARKI